jgi:CheY-like chemotaxis protein
MPKILCIDDSVSGLSVRRQLFQRHGHEVATARSGVEGIERFRKEKFELVVVDYVMPEMNGGETIRQLRKINPNIAIILLSGYADTLALEHRVPEADAVLHKGRSREVKELLETADHLLNKRRRKPMAKAKAAATRAKNKNAAPKRRAK